MFADLDDDIADARRFAKSHFYFKYVGLAVITWVVDQGGGGREGSKREAGLVAGRASLRSFSSSSLSSMSSSSSSFSSSSSSSLSWSWLGGREGRLEVFFIVVIVLIVIAVIVHIVVVIVSQM